MIDKVEGVKTAFLEFIQHVCHINRDAYTQLMVRENEEGKDGYRVAMEKFYLVTGRMTKEDRDALFNEGTLPAFAIEAISKAEQQAFGITLVNHR